MKLEAYLDEEFGLLRVAPHITHIRAHIDGRELPSAVTLATVDPVNIETMRHVLVSIEHAYYNGDFTQSLASYMKQMLESDGCAGVAVCDHRDQFNRKRGRIIAKGRLLKLLRKERLER